MADISRGGKLPTEDEEEPKENTEPNDPNYWARGLLWADQLDANMNQGVARGVETQAKGGPRLFRAYNNAQIKGDKKARTAALNFLSANGDRIRQAFEAASPAQAAINREISSTATPSALLAQLNAEAQAVKPSMISQALEERAMEQLALGDSLSAGEERNVAQASRAAYSDRGLAMSNRSIVDEVLNRDAAGRQRMLERTGLASGIDQILLGEQGQNRNFAMGVEGLNQQDDASDRAFLSQSQAQDPVRALLGINSGAALGAAVSGYETSTRGPLAGMGVAHDTWNTYFNRDEAQRIAELNRRTALQSTKMQTDSADRAADLALWGSVIEGVGNVAGAAAGCWVAREVFGHETVTVRGGEVQKWHVFRMWLLHHANPVFRWAYQKYGERAAKWLRNHEGVKDRIRPWMERKVQAHVAWLRSIPAPEVVIN